MSPATSAWPGLRNRKSSARSPGPEHQCGWSPLQFFCMLTGGYEEAGQQAKRYWHSGLHLRSFERLGEGNNILRLVRIRLELDS